MTKNEEIATQVHNFRVKENLTVGNATKRIFRHRHIGYNPYLFGVICRMVEKMEKDEEKKLQKPS